MSFWITEITGCDGRTQRQKTTQNSKMRYLADIFPTWFMWWFMSHDMVQTNIEACENAFWTSQIQQKWDRQDNAWAVRRQELRLSRLFFQKMRHVPNKMSLNFRSKTKTSRSCSRSCSPCWLTDYGSDPSDYTAWLQLVSTSMGLQRSFRGRERHFTNRSRLAFGDFTSFVQKWGSGRLCSWKHIRTL